MTQAMETKQAKFHLPADLHAYLKHAAIESRRSLNAEVAVRLIESRKQDQANKAAQQ